MIIIAEYRLVKQGGLFFRKGEGGELLPGMLGRADGARAADPNDDRQRGTKCEAGHPPSAV